MLVACKQSGSSDPVNVFRTVMLLVVTVLILHKQNNVKAAQGAYGKADDVNKTECFVLQQKANSGFEVAFYHG
jgi:hypothetical protein